MGESGAARRARRVVFVSNIFPNHREPLRGIFNLHQLRALRDRGWSIAVLAPVFTFPFHRTRYGPRASEVCRQETVEGFRTVHPRARYLPLSRGALNAVLYEWSIGRSLRQMVGSEDPSFLWSSFVFPDSVAVGRISRKLGLPHVASALGSDVHIGVRNRSRARPITRQLGEARVVLAKSRELADVVIGQGVESSRVSVDYNGVDRSVFRFRPAEEASRRLRISGGTDRILFVGGLVPVKSVETLLEAFRILSASLGDVELVLVGDGYSRGDLEKEAARLGVLPRTRFLGRRGPEEVALWMNASTVFCLPSRSEGVPNVVIEALASGCPVVATRVGGVPEVHPGSPVGALVPPADPGKLTTALRECLRREWDRPAVAASMDGWSWESNAEKVEALFRAAGLVE
jgi:teichuronic acid biosynthesis glycosyltransferase TuaC